MRFLQVLFLSILSCSKAFITGYGRERLHCEISRQPRLFGGWVSESVRRCASVRRSTALFEEGGDDICRIQILMSDTGGGHRASANALRDALDVLYPGKFECDIVDIYTDYGSVWPYNDYVAIYKLMAKYPVTWDVFYHFGATEAGLCLNEFLLETICYDSFKVCLQRPSGTSSKRADMVVSVHPLCQDIPLKILADLDSQGRTRARSARKTPFCTVVTDLGSAHPTWFNPGVDKCFVPSDALNKAARNRGLKASQIVQYGLPIRKGFWQSPSMMDPSGTKESTAMRSQLRDTLGLDQSLPAVLVVGGGDGMGGLVDISKALGSRLGRKGGNNPSYQMVVVCGNNDQARKQLEGTQWPNGVSVRVTGFVNNMQDWMKASDVLVTKAGPGTIAEASICGLPCMLFAFLPGQEKGNIPFVENAGFGKYSENPLVIADTVTSWVASPEKLRAMQQAALDASRPNATLDIAMDLATIAFRHKKLEQSVQQLRSTDPALSSTA